MTSDVSGNDQELTVESKEVEVIDADNETGNDVDYENVQTETAAISTYDYTSNFQNIESNLAINNALLLACILLIGLLMGLRKL